jgi:signal transduction histidine kinase
VTAPVALSPAGVSLPTDTVAAPAPAPAEAVPRRWWSLTLRGVLIAFVLCLLLGLWAWVLAETGAQARALTEQSRSRMDNLARAFAEHTTRTLEGADQVLRFIRREYLRDGARLDIEANLRRGDVIDAHYHLLTVIGADGEVVDTSQPAFQRVNLRDREHFRVHAESRADRLFISRPVVGRVSGKTSIQVTRRAGDEDGRFTGVVVLSLAPEVFTDFLRHPNEANGDLLLAGLDGVVRARAAGTDHELGRSIAGSTLLAEALRQGRGSLVARSPIDGLERLYAFRVLDGYGLVAFSGLSTERLEQSLRERQLRLYAAAVLVSVALLAFLGVMLRAERRRQAMVQRLRRSEQQAHAANEARKRLLRGVSHELRTPLNGILNYAELIRDTSTDPEAREFGAIVHHSAEQLRTLLSSLADLARVEAGRPGLQLEPVALPALLQELLRVHQRTAVSRGLTLSLQVDPDAEQAIVSDRVRLLQLLNHLVTNALKFTERGGVRLSLAAGDGSVLIGVQDSGVGMTPAQLAALSAPPGSGALAELHHGAGPGLGLPLARELTEQLGGELHLESQPGQGTLAQLRLPVRPAQAPGVPGDPMAAEFPSAPSRAPAGAGVGASGISS